MLKWIKQLLCLHTPDLKNHGVWSYGPGGKRKRRILYCTKCKKYYPAFRKGGYDDNDKRFINNTNGYTEETK